MTSRVRFVAGMDDNVSSKLDKIRDRFDQLGASKGAQSILMGVGLSAGTAAMDVLGGSMSRLVDVIGGSIAAASNLNETVSAGRVIFGDSASAVEEWAATAADAFGQSERQAIDAANTFATFGKSAGLAGRDLVGFSTRMTELASDLASFKNTAPDEAIQAIGAALRGESEPIRRYGVLLDDASLRQEALRLGLIKTTTQALTPQQRVLAAQAAILKQTSDAQGDFARTSDGLANTQRTLNAQLEDLTASIGQELLPVAVLLANVVKDDVVPAMRGLIQTAKDAEPVWRVLGLAVDTVVSGPLGAGLNEAKRQVEDFRETQQRELIAAAGTWSQSAEGIAEATREANRGIAGMRRETNDLGVATTTTIGGIKRDLDGLAAYYDGLVKRLTQSGQAAAAAIYDPIIARGKLAATEREIAEQREIVASEESTRAQVADAKLRILELTKTKTELLSELQGFGQLTKAEFLKINRDLTAKLSEASDAQRASIQALIRDLNLAQVAAQQAAGAMEAIGGGAGGGIGRGTGGRAHGGPVWPGTWTVGEQGPETLVLGPSGRGYIVPNQGGGGGGTVNITLNANGVNDPVQLLQMLRRELDRSGMSLA